MKIRSSRVYIEEKLQPKVIEIIDHKIVNIFDYDSEYDLDFKDNMILPGFIDIHTHGFNGVNANYPTLEGLKMWSNNYLTEGVTSFLATTATQGFDDNIKALETIATYIENQNQGSEILGINIEGNFIDHTYRGAQNENFIVKPSIEDIDAYIKASNNNIKAVICAVEHDENYNFVKHLHNLNISVAVGHSSATYQEVKDSIKYGVSGAVHTGNGMRPFHHREPGVLGASINEDEIYAEVIVDGHHLHFETVSIIGRIKGKDKLILVTDSSSYKGYNQVDDNYKRIISSDGTIRNEAGNLSGSALKFNEGVYNAINHAKLPFVTVINAATINPAKYLKVDNKKGSIEINKDADLVVVDDNFKVIKTFNQF